MFENTFRMTIDGYEHAMTYVYCPCNTYLVSAFMRWGKCGRCGEKPVGYFPTREDAELERHGGFAT